MWYPIMMEQSIQVKNTYSALHIDGLVQNCSDSIANALDLMQSFFKPSTYSEHMPITSETFLGI